MRAREIILELREYMNRSDYGCWIDASTNKIHPVAHQGHTEWVQDYVVHKYHPDRSELYYFETKGWYQVAFEEHFVRVGYGNRTHITISGLSEDIQKVAFMLLATCVQPDVNTVWVEKVELSKFGRMSGKESDFSLPEDRRKLMMFLKNETDE